MLRQDVEQTRVQVLGLGYSLDLGPLCTVALNPKPYVIAGFVYHLRAKACGYRVGGVDWCGCLRASFNHKWFESFGLNVYED